MAAVLEIFVNGFMKLGISGATILTGFGFLSLGTILREKCSRTSPPSASSTNSFGNDSEELSDSLLLTVLPRALLFCSDFLSSSSVVLLFLL